MEEYEAYFEYIVIGCGGVGSGALYWLAKKARKSKFSGSQGFSGVKLQP